MFAVLLMLLVLTESCVSTTLIQSNPSGAKVYINDEPMGTTPFYYRDSKIVGTENTVKLEKEGFEITKSVFSRDEEIEVGALIGGIFVWIPFLWLMKYKKVHNYDMLPIGSNNATNTPVPSNTNSTKADKLRELKKLFDEKVITQEEFEKEKKKILDEPDK